MNAPRLTRPPRTVFQILGEAVLLYIRNFRFVFSAAVFILVPFSILSIFVTSHYETTSFLHQMSVALQSVLSGTSSTSSQTADLLASRGYTWLTAVSFISTFLVTPLLDGILVFFVLMFAVNGSRASLNDASSHTFRRLLPYIGTLIVLALLGIGCVFVCFIVISLISALVAVAGLGSIVFGILLALVVLFLIFLAVRIGFALIATLADRIGGFTAVLRSWQLTRRHFWRTLVFFIMVLIFTSVLRTLLSYLLGAMNTSVVAESIILAIYNLFVQPWAVLATTLYYVDLLVRQTTRFGM
ncbi:hypothetical protein [Alicyclobacillus sp. SP_1]|uniref:hypothetical protein n=1 Tax=Alicyclobacillus sp. SP_1 TaxID=2942475 RepID=UPI002157D938|nr:hypothetical protein [Alicyclobacillus sp. SP_1]